MAPSIGYFQYQPGVDAERSQDSPLQHLKGPLQRHWNTFFFFGVIAVFLHVFLTLYYSVLNCDLATAACVTTTQRRDRPQHFAYE